MNAVLRTLLAVLGTTVLLTACERPPVDSIQSGPRGTGMQQVYNPRTLAANAGKHTVPEALPPASSDGPKASAVYQNVKVLGDLSVGEFTRLMAAMTAWVSPEQGCTYCHNPANFAEDSKYTKVVARRMVEMTQHINQDWKAHVANTGVTCYTCHRGNPQPVNTWFTPVEPKQTKRAAGGDAGQNSPAKSVALASLPYDPFTPFLLESKPIRVAGTAALPEGNRSSIKQTEWTYGLMMHMADGLGVNCTFCHNSQSFGNWETSPPQRTTAWHGIRMAKDLNVAYMSPLTPAFPPERLGPVGDVAKVNCATCHQGAYKPLNGESMLKNHPELAGVKRLPPATATGTPLASAAGN